MKNFHLSNTDMTGSNLDVKDAIPGFSRHLLKIPIISAEYHEPSVNQQEMEDFDDSVPILIRHSDSTSIGLKSTFSTQAQQDIGKVLDVPLLEFDLYKEIEKIKQEVNLKSIYQRSKTLSKSENMSVVLMAIHPHNELKMHQADGPITLQVFEGNIQFLTWQSCVTIKAGQFITLHKNVQHHIMAKEQSIILLTIMHMNNINTEEPEEKEQEIEEKDKEVVETSENINFPDFPTYPPEDDVYKEPVEPEVKEEA